MKNFILLTLFLTAVSGVSAQNANADFEKATKAGKSVFLVITDNKATGTENVFKTTEGVVKTKKNTALVKLNRDDKENSGLVAKYKLSAIAVPMVLIVASNGVISGGLTASDVTAEKLIAYLPTPIQAQVLKGFEDGKAALIICGKKNSKDKTNLETECKTASEKLSGKAKPVFVDVENKEEKNFLDLIKPDMTKTTLLVFNGKGQYTGTLEATAKSADIIAAVNKRIGGGCCPGGSSSGCGKK